MSVRQKDVKEDGYMRTPRLAGLGLATMATVTLAMAGCGDGTTTAPPASQITEAPDSFYKSLGS